ncbi:MAG TPA: hypothetical protein VMY34_05325, partial [Acidimicrobiales bacterium]|nr:hypothetical protein [Acidimicrobiales bacterium]
MSTSRTVVPADSTTERISARNEIESLAINTSGTSGRLVPSVAAQPSPGGSELRAVEFGFPLVAPRSGGERSEPDVQEDLLLDIQLENADGYTICRPIGELDAFTV